MVEGGVFTILHNCLEKLAKYSQNDDLRIFALVHNASNFDFEYKDSIQFIEFSKSKKYWLNRLYYEYFYFKKLSKKLKPDIWLSLHDVSPNVICNNQFVYCHNSNMFYKPKLKDWILEPKVGLFAIFYKYVYQINLANNKAVFVQQNWIKTEFKNLFNLKNIEVATPENVEEKEIISVNLDPNKIHFFYPSFSRSFKNFELIGKAVKLLPDSIKNKIEVHLTISKNDNNYSKHISKKYNLKPIHFIGKISRTEVFGYYKKMDCLLFPSKLETWGLPITEAKGFEKPILAANLPYAKETVGNYDKVSFFDIENPKELANLIIDFVNRTIQFQGNKDIFDKSDQLKNWNAIFDFMLKN